MDPIVIAFSFAESEPFGRVGAVECAQIRRAWCFGNQPVPAVITPNGGFAEHVLA